MTRKDIKNLTPEMIEAKIRELENAYELLLKEYNNKKMELINDLVLLQQCQQMQKADAYKIMSELLLWRHQ